MFGPGPMRDTFFVMWAIFSATYYLGWAIWRFALKR
jgi:hypothetical protein